MEEIMAYPQDQNFVASWSTWIKFSNFPFPTCPPVYFLQSIYLIRMLSQVDFPPPLSVPGYVIHTLLSCREGSGTSPITCRIMVDSHCHSLECLYLRCSEGRLLIPRLWRSTTTPQFRKQVILYNIMRMEEIMAQPQTKT